jgi:paired amphipathic helix protein Sin3a
VKELFKGHPNLILGFNPFLPPAFQITEEDLREEEKPAPTPRPNNPDVLDNARQYVQKIKTRFTNEPLVYKSFLKILYNFKNEKHHTVQEVYEQIVVLFNKHQDLIDEFSQFLSDVETPSTKAEDPKKPQEVARAHAKANENAPQTNNPPKATRQKRTPTVKNTGADEESAGLVTAEDLQLFQVIKKGLNEVSKDHWNDCLKVLEMYNLGVIGRKETISILYRLFGDGELFEKLRVFMNISKEDFERIKNITYSTGLNVDEEDEDSLDDDEEEDDEKRQRIFSYYFEEDDEESNVFPGQTPEDKKVLNNNWVSQPPRRDDYRFKASPKNIYEENLFECEDGRYEMDLLVEKNAGLKQNLIKLENDWKTKNYFERRGIPLADLIGLTYLDHFKTLYGPDAEEYLKLLVQHPSAVIPVVVAMLNRKEIEINEKKIIFTEKWKVICAENSLKSLDHRGQYWKEQETLNLKARTILTEISDSFRTRQVNNNNLEKSNQPENQKQFDLVWTRKEFILFSSLKELLLEAKNAFFSKSLTIYLLNTKEKEAEISEEKKDVANQVDMKKVDRLLFFIETFLSCCISPNTENGMKVENNHGNKTKVFYADKNLVVLWRYLEILLDQLHVAWNFESGAEEHVKFKQHMQHMVLLMNGKMEAANFEEKCMSLFGANSYFLFSADTLLDAIFKYMKLILSDSASGELCSKLIEEFLMKKDEKEYSENCAKLLKNAHQPLFEITITSKFVDSTSQNNSNNNNNININTNNNNNYNNNNNHTEVVVKSDQEVKSLKRTSGDMLLDNDQNGRATKKAKLSSIQEFQITIQQLS